MNEALDGTGSIQPGGILDASGIDDRPQSRECDKGRHCQRSATKIEAQASSGDPRKDKGSDSIPRLTSNPFTRPRPVRE